MAFQIGDTVVLKSGGPLMTIDDVGAGDGPDVIISCFWFEKTERKQANFKAAMLEAEKKMIGGLHSAPRTRR
jgi:uncharacterized protein YodC (DUF2158 family)